MRALLLLLLAAASLAAGAQLVGDGALGAGLLLPGLPEMPAKSTWPELVGRPCAEAKAAIEASGAGLTVFVVPEHAMVTMDFRTDRVRVFCRREGNTVAAVPRVG